MPSWSEMLNLISFEIVVIVRTSLWAESHSKSNITNYSYLQKKLSLLTLNFRGDSHEDGFNEVANTHPPRGLIVPLEVLLLSNYFWVKRSFLILWKRLLRRPSRNRWSTPLVRRAIRHAWRICPGRAWCRRATCRRAAAVARRRRALCSTRRGQRHP